MTSYVLRPGVYGKATPAHVQMIARLDRAAAARAAAQRQAATSAAAAATMMFYPAMAVGSCHGH